MFQNYLKTALRNFTRNKVTTLINVLSLSIGISAALIIFMVVEYDFSFDKYEPAKERIYRIVTEGDGWKNQGVLAPLQRAVQNNVAGIETTAGFFQYNDWYTKVSVPQGNNKPPQVFKKQNDIVFADSNYFGIFPYVWIAGNAKASLKNPYNLVISEAVRKSIFQACHQTS